MSLNIPGLVVMLIFYLMVLGTGIWASWKSKQVKDSSQADQTDITLLGNRGISLLVGIFTTTGKCVMETDVIRVIIQFTFLSQENKMLVLQV